MPRSPKAPLIVRVNDRMLTGYRYKLTEPIGANYHLEFRLEPTGNPFRACLEQTDVGHDTARVGNQ